MVKTREREVLRMKRSQKLTHFLAGVLTAVLALSLTVPALAAAGVNITVYPGVALYLDDAKLNPTDANGKPVDVFVYNGTTYLPVRAVSEALNIPVQWDGSSRTVYLGKHAGSASYLLTVCPPYQSDHFDSPATVTMSGRKYANCITLGLTNFSDAGFALFNLDGRYDTLTFTVGHIDGRSMDTSSYDIYLDGDLTYSIDLDPEAMPEEYEIDLNGALQMKIVGNNYAGRFALADMKVS